jgi:hypothetical protein
VEHHQRQVAHTRLANIFLWTLVFPWDFLSLGSTIDPRNWILISLYFLRRLTLQHKGENEKKEWPINHPAILFCQEKEKTVNNLGIIRCMWALI